MTLSRSRKVVSLSGSLNHKLNMYALAASAAGVSLLALEKPADAKIVYTKANQKIVGVVPLDLNKDGTADFNLVGSSLSSVTFFNRSLWISSAGGNAGANQAMGKVKTSSINSASALKAGAQIGPKGAFHAGVCDLMAVSYGNATNGSTVVKGAWAKGGKGLTNRYLGLKFLIKDQTHYGWARLNVKLHPLLGTLTGYAYETVAKKAIVAGKTKGAEVIAMPSGLGELAAWCALPSCRPAAVFLWRVIATAATEILPMKWVIKTTVVVFRCSSSLAALPTL